MACNSAASLSIGVAVRRAWALPIQIQYSNPMASEMPRITPTRRAHAVTGGIGPPAGASSQAASKQARIQVMRMTMSTAYEVAPPALGRDVSDRHTMALAEVRR